MREFSGGERQRLGIATAAINNPDLLILDEPASALDPIGRRDVLQIIRSFGQQSTVFYSTHILNDVQRVSDMVVILEQGRLLAQGDINQLVSGDRNLFRVTVCGDGLAVRDRLQQIPWIDKIALETGMPDIKNDRTTSFKSRSTIQTLPKVNYFGLY